MRALVVALGLFAFAATADAKARPKSKVSVTAKKRGKQTAKRDDDRRDERRIGKRGEKRNAKRGSKANDKRDAGGKRGRKSKRVAHASHRHRPYEMPRGPISGQSLGAPWSGRLHDATELHPGTGYVIRRPWRAFGTAATVETIEHIVSDVADRYYDTHPIAIGDISAEHGGRISDHSSHQSGRDVDIGLIFTQKPAAYPESFVAGTADNLDLEATYVLVDEFARTHDAGGVLMIFLDFKVQGLLYNWGLENGEDPEWLSKLFQFPHGRGENVGIVRHEPNHGDHIHVRFQCPPNDALCQ
jgi:murein endopeptidase